MESVTTAMRRHAGTMLTSFGRPHDHRAHVTSVQGALHVARRPSPARASSSSATSGDTSRRARTLPAHLDDAGHHVVDKQATRRRPASRHARPRLDVPSLSHISSAVYGATSDSIKRHRLGCLTHSRIGGTGT